MISIYVDTPGGIEDEYGASAPGWQPLAENVPANLQPLTGDVRQMAAGREIGATWKCFVPPGTSVREDAGVVVLSGVGPTTFRVRQVGQQGGKWDTEMLLGITQESIG